MVKKSEYFLQIAALSFMFMFEMGPRDFSQDKGFSEKKKKKCVNVAGKDRPGSGACRVCGSSSDKMVQFKFGPVGNKNSVC